MVGTQSKLSLSARRAWIEIPYLQIGRQCEIIKSLSARRAWIEIVGAKMAACAWIPSLSARRAWIEMIARMVPRTARLSLSARRAWIEI